jgi:hypothetical protein
MINKKAKQTIFYTLGMGFIVLIAAKLSGGAYFNKVIPMSTALIFAGIVASMSIVMKGKKIDQECDERENYISDKAMRYNFFFMSAFIMAAFAYEVARSGSMGSIITLVLYAFWGSYIVFYGFFKVKY